MGDDQLRVQLGAGQERRAAGGRPGLRGALLVLLTAALPACGAARGTTAAVPREAEQITRALEESAERWNQGDLEGFLAPYLDSPATTFVGSSGLVRGKAEIERRYRQSYWKEGAPDQRLRFAGLEVRPLGKGHALVTGRYLLFDRGGAQVAQGPFSLVFARTPEGWRIIHDHSS